MADKKNNGLELQETRGSFQLKGIVTGTEKDGFYKEVTTKSNKPMRMVNFGVSIEKDKTVYVNLNGMERDTVFFSKTEGNGKDRKTVTEKVAWKDRFSFNKEGFRPIGVNVGITKIIDRTGNEVNDKKNMFEYDVCKYIGDNLEDDMSVFVRGKIEFSTYNDKHQTKFIPNQISLCKPVDFDAEDFEATGFFEQVIVFTGIKKNDDTNNFAVSAKIITYDSVEETEFIVENPKLAKNLKSLKPYTAIKVFGDIRIERDVEEVSEEDDGWGTPNKMERINNPTTRTLVITGADKDSIDTELYSEKNVEAAIEKMNASKAADKDFGDTEDWGSLPIKGKSAADEEDDEWD